MIDPRTGRIGHCTGDRILFRSCGLIFALIGLMVATAGATEPWFVDIPEDRSGLDFRFRNGSRGRFDLPEIMGGGFALADFDADGLPDLFFCQGGPIDQPAVQRQMRESRSDSNIATANDPPCVWYKNLGGMRFRRVEAGLPGPSYAMGAWPADFDADGLVDLFVTGWQGWALYRNLGGWKFEDRTAELGQSIPAWSTAAVWRDFDRDGRLDLFVGGYLEFDARRAPFCAAPDGSRDYCGPEDFRPVANRLFAGTGQGRFADVSDRLGTTRQTGRTLGVLAFDFDSDGDEDLFVANDGTACELLMQQKGGSFRDEAIDRGLAFDSSGNPLAAMGVAVVQEGDRTDLFVTNFFGRGTVQFRSQAGRVFRDISAETGLKQATARFNGFGIAVTDFEGDGVNEVVQANGHVLSRERLGTPFAMPPVLLRLSNASKYERVEQAVFPVTNRPMLGRGLAVADLDGDSKPDLLIAALDGPPVLLRNVTPGQVRGLSKSGATWAGGSYLSGTPPGGMIGRSP